MNNISICIPTYKRPLMLSKLVLSILACNLNRSLIRDINIIIIDNDIDKTAEKIASELNDKTSAPYKFYYYQFPLKGLANVRNELIRNAFLVNADFIVF
ncbi:MAG TPA: glycosyltransferase, partial [Verrucomicrobiae bacterium]|nr:glycosyltransferase [Verrucomicrobiae bacterium]